MNAFKACLIVAAVGGAGATALCCFAGPALLPVSDTSWATPTRATEPRDPLATVPSTDEPANLIVDAPVLLRKRISTVEETLGEPTKIWYPGEAGSPLTASESGQWRVYLVNTYFVDVYFGEDDRAHEIRLGVSYEALPDEGYDLEAASAFELLSRMGMGPEMLDRMPDHEFYDTESGDLLAWRWDNLHGYDVALVVTSPTGHISAVEISR